MRLKEKKYTKSQRRKEQKRNNDKQRIEMTQKDRRKFRKKKIQRLFCSFVLLLEDCSV